MDATLLALCSRTPGWQRRPAAYNLPMGSKHTRLLLAWLCTGICPWQNGLSGDGISTEFHACTVIYLVSFSLDCPVLYKWLQGWNVGASSPTSASSGQDEKADLLPCGPVTPAPKAVQFQWKPPLKEQLKDPETLRGAFQVSLAFFIPVKRKKT